MYVIVRQLVGPIEILRAARITCWKDSTDVQEPSEQFLTNMYRSEHSPIREELYSVEMFDIPRWVADHLVRHHIGCQPYMSTQRTDRNSNVTSRHDLPQDAPVNLRLTINAQSLLSISKVRLCSTASKETRELWTIVCKEVRNINPILGKFLVPQCVYKGTCTEFHTNCKFTQSETWLNMRRNYVRGE